MNKLRALRENEKVQKILASPLTYLTGAILLGVLNILHYITLQSGLSVTGAFYAFINGLDSVTLGPTLQNVALFLGALIAALSCAKFRFRKIRSTKQVITSVIGGLLMGYGAGIAGGCNISAFFSAAASLSLSGWVFLIFLFAGAFLGIKILYKFL